MKSHLKNQAKLILACLLGLLLTSCGNELKTMSSVGGLGSELIDDGLTNQAAKINCDLYLNNEASAYRSISTISGADTFTRNALEGESIKFDCSKTEDEDSVDALQFAIDTNYVPSSPNFVPVEGKVFSLSGLSVGRHSMALKVTDTKGKERIKTFTTVVECIDAQAPVLNTAGVSITASNRLNYFNYSINPAMVSNGESFQYAWDFNGDLVFDPVSLDNPNEIWTSNSTLQDVYSIFVTRAGQSRQISVKVKNECEKESTYTIQAQFPSENIARNPTSLAEIRPYFYLQADLAATSGGNNDLLDPRKNGDLLVTQYPQDTSLRRIECDYKKTRENQNAVFTMKAYNYYKSGSEYQHGMDIQIRDIPDNLTQGTQEIPLGVANLAVARYRVSAADDGLVSEVYDRNAACSVKLRIIRDRGVTPCAADRRSQADFSEDSEAITILGEYSCPSLRDANTLETVKLDNGKFFCQVAPTNQCVGGGGGGGGNPPPEQ